MAFPERFIEELISRSDIVDVVSSYVALTKRSGSSMFGLCPFHNEKTPSFSVSADKQIYHCFGCGKGGGVINFIMEIENLSYPDAVYFLAKRAGLTVPEDDRPDPNRGRRARMLELNRDAARFFYDMLSRPEGAAAVEYINRRGLTKKMVTSFGLGAAPDSWTNLTDAMMKKGYTAKELTDAGLAKVSRNGRGGVYDMFRNRLMFPVIDVRGSVIGFSGRILGDGEPKYLNSPDTLVFNKSRNLFALNLAKKSKLGMLILAEGNIDVVSLHQAGFDCAVASLGTSLTSEQARLMTRYTQEAIIAYDSDGAGIKAAQRAIGILESVGLKVRVLRIPGAKDPDEFIQKNGADAFRLILDKSENYIDYQLLILKDKYDLKTDDGRVAFLSEATELIAGLKNSAEREIYGTKAAEYAGVTKDGFLLDVRRAVKSKGYRAKKQAERRELMPRGRQSGSAIRYEREESAPAEEGVLGILTAYPDMEPMTAQLSPEDFSSDFSRKAFSIIRRRIRDGKSVEIPMLQEELEPDEISRLTLIASRPENRSNSEKAMADYIDKIKESKIKSQGAEDLRAYLDVMKQKKGLGDNYGK